MKWLTFEVIALAQINIDKYIYRSEKPTLISFVSLNCPACNDMIPHWNNAIKKYQKNTNFLMIIVGKNRGEIESMLSKHKILGNVIVDHDNEILTDFGVRVTPFAFATDKMGIVKDKGLCNNLLHIEHFISGVTNDNEISKQKILEKGVKVHA
ncbi:MAG: redoxin domain-containing protein [Bacillus sp. (in: firmicutes)]